MNLDPKPLQPGATIGLLGGGQLAQMLVLAGHAMGFRFIVLEPIPACPAALAGAEQITASYTDPEALAKLADSCKLVTYEFENVDLEKINIIIHPLMLTQMLISYHMLKAAFCHHPI